MRLKLYFLLGSCLNSIFSVLASPPRPEVFSDFAAVMIFPGIDETTAGAEDRLRPLFASLPPDMKERIYVGGWNRPGDSWFQLPNAEEVGPITQYAMGLSQERPDLFKRLDAAAATVGAQIAQWIAERKLNPEKVILSGHSQGGMLAPFVAAWLSQKGAIYEGESFQLGRIYTSNAPLLLDRYDLERGGLPVQGIISYMGTEDKAFHYLGQGAAWIQNATRMLPTLAAVTMVPTGGGSSQIENFMLGRDHQKIKWTLVRGDTDHARIDHDLIQKVLVEDLGKVVGQGASGASSSSSVSAEGSSFRASLSPARQYIDAVVQGQGRDAKDFVGHYAVFSNGIKSPIITAFPLSDGNYNLLLGVRPDLLASLGVSPSFTLASVPEDARITQATDLTNDEYNRGWVRSARNSEMSDHFFAPKSKTFSAGMHIYLADGTEGIVKEVGVTPDGHWDHVYLDRPISISALARDNTIYFEKP